MESNILWLNSDSSQVAQPLPLCTITDHRDPICSSKEFNMTKHSIAQDLSAAGVEDQNFGGLSFR